MSPTPPLKQTYNLGVILLTTVVFIGIGFQSFRIAQSERVENVTEFSLSNSLEVYKDTTLKRECNPMSLDLSCVNNDVIRSPYFPYLGLRTENIKTGDCSQERGENTSTDSIYIHRDPFWQLSWIEKSVCLEEPIFYGPFR